MKKLLKNVEKFLKDISNYRCIKNILENISRSRKKV